MTSVALIHLPMEKTNTEGKRIGKSPRQHTHGELERPGRLIANTTTILKRRQIDP